mmetsp:Transcript_3699/g.8450  ORF Transcript_3699/g.8450 Transcript_3699/m.8450 type:complete len:495 (+) Transcript_3699:165-1649(+)
MQVRRKHGSRTRVSVRNIVLGCSALVVVIYVMTFRAAIRSHPPVPSEIPEAKQSPGAGAHFRGAANQQQPLEASPDHSHHYDKIAVERLGADEQEHELAPVAMEAHDAASNNNDNNNNNDGGEATTIGFAVSITGCGSDPITEGAAVLKHSIHLASVHGELGGKYDYQMYAIYHPAAIKCAKTLEALGYTLLERETPVAVKDIEGDYLRSKIEKNGCCGEKELIKLEAYTLTQHPAIVHMDLDTLVLKPLDGLFDWMLAGDEARSFDSSAVTRQFPAQEIPEKINAFFTRDFNMCGPHKKIKPVQGGFLVLRPDMTVYNEFVEIIRKGHFTNGGGWGGVTGVFYGSMTFQGIIPYFYDVLHAGTAVEVNHCIYNQMADNPRNKRTVNDVVDGICMTGEEDCEDCRSRPLEDVSTSHFTLCQKPWLCLPQDDNVIQQRLCRKLHHEWYRIRSDLEKSWGRTGTGEGTYQAEHFNGYCTRHGKKGYLYIQEPFGVP